MRADSQNSRKEKAHPMKRALIAALLLAPLGLGCQEASAPTPAPAAPVAATANEVVINPLKFPIDTRDKDAIMAAEKTRRERRERLGFAATARVAPRPIKLSADEAQALHQRIREDGLIPRPEVTFTPGAAGNDIH